MSIFNNSYIMFIILQANKLDRALTSIANNGFHVVCRLEKMLRRSGLAQVMHEDTGLLSMSHCGLIIKFTRFYILLCCCAVILQTCVKTTTMSLILLLTLLSRSRSRVNSSIFFLSTSDCFLLTSSSAHKINRFHSGA